jgi:hypothetical protein
MIETCREYIERLEKEELFGVVQPYESIKDLSE